MARIQPVPEDTKSIKKFLGVNESNPKMGEFSTMRNFKISNDFELIKRPGTQNVANLLFNYDIDVGDEETVLTELNLSTEEFTVYPNLNITDGGILYLLGTSAEMNYTNHDTYTDYYWQNELGSIFKFADSVYTAASGTHVTGGSVSIAAGNTIFSPVAYYTEVAVENGAVVTAGTTGTPPTALYGLTSSGLIYLYDYVSESLAYGKLVTYRGDDLYQWNFYPIAVIPNSAESEVRGIWSGRVSDSEVICAACNNRLWVLSESSGVWSKQQVGSINTESKVHMFGFDEKLYIMNGQAYLSWDGTTHTEHTYTCLGTETGDYYIAVDEVNYKFALSTPDEDALLIFNEYDLTLKLDGADVEYTTGAVTTETNLTSSLAASTVYDPVESVVGYRPLVAHARTYDGATSTLRERVNMLNGLRRVQFSPDGSHATFTLPEKPLASIDYAKVVATGADIAITSSSLPNGTVTFTSNPSAGTDSIEIGYTVSTTYRSLIEAMTRAELYNGQNDNRVFVYGDGSNATYYSGLDYDGQPTAEYFPDLNVVHVGEANTPIYDLLRHYDELMTFKDGSAHRIKYGQLTLVDGTLTAAFYAETINKTLGGTGYGQAQLVQNRPRTLDGRSIYEWIATTSSGGITSDQRNAQRISENVETTLRTMDLSNAMTFYDKINQEYFIVEDGVAIVQNTAIVPTNQYPNGIWCIYEDFPAICMIVYKDELYFGTSDGYIRHVSSYTHDIGEAIDCYAKTSPMDFGKGYMRKYSDVLWVGVKPGGDALVKIETDKKADYVSKAISAAAGNDRTKVIPVKFKASDFSNYSVIFESNTNSTAVTIAEVNIKVREIGKI